MKFRILSIITLCLFATFTPIESRAQGLAERRAIKEYQDKKYPDLKKQIDTAAGFEVQVSVDWDKIAKPDMAESYMNDDYITNISFLPLVSALKDITKDQMGKDALKAKFKEVHITYDEATAPASNYPNGLKFESGKLTINFQPYSNVDGTNDNNFKERTDAIKKLLEANL